ncbi:MAG TPA: DoxX family protein [Flavobacteriales bacterium]|nr:DoxX family protein [Flavobacteriales bacterium]
MRNIGLLLLRLGISLQMITHGWGKFLNLLHGNLSFADPIGIGESASLMLTVFAEFICSVLIAIGFKTRWAAIPPAITMLVAAFIVHFSDPWGKKELAVIYFTGFVSIALLGPGKYSLDKK